MRKQEKFPSTLHYASCPENMLWQMFGCKLRKSKRAVPLIKGKLLIGIFEGKSKPVDYKDVILGFSWGRWFLITCGV